MSRRGEVADLSGRAGLGGEAKVVSMVTGSMVNEASRRGSHPGKTKRRPAGVFALMARRGVLLCALLALVGCDDGTLISNVSRTVALDDGRVRAMAGSEELIPVEIHGALWPSIDAGAIAGRMRLPNRFPPELRFQVAPIGSLDRDIDKLVLIFNPAAPPRPTRDCASSKAIETRQPQDGPFELFALFCNGSDWMGHGALRASRQAAGDWDEFVRVTRVLFSQILADFTGRSEK